MVSNSERQKKFRERKKEKGFKEFHIFLSLEQVDLCKVCYEKSLDSGDSFKEFLMRSLVKGVVFQANSGSGKRIRNNGGCYSVTK